MLQQATNMSGALPNAGAKRKEVDKEVQKMLKTVVIDPSCSSYNSPFVLVKKKDGTNRFCIDFRRLNAITKFDTEPMGNMENIMTTLWDHRYFTKIELVKGFRQIPVMEESKPMTSFSTHNGTYQFRMMPFGLVNSRAAFNKMTRKFLKGCDKVDNYVGDKLGHTMSWESHLQVLQNVITRIQLAGLTLRPTKSYIRYKTMDLTGQLVGEGEVRVEDERINKIKSAKKPASKKQMRSFLGLANYYRNYYRSAINRPYQEGDVQQGRVGTSSGASI